MSVLRTHYYRRRRQRRLGHEGFGSKSWLAFMAAPIAVALVGCGVALVASGASYYANVTGSAQPLDEALSQRGGGARVFDRNGVLLYEFIDERYGRQDPVTLDQISQHVLDATIAAEDASFYTNPGINIRGLARAAGENLRPGDGFLEGTGGSSITQQLVKQVYFTPEERQERSIERKLKEAALAVQVTQDYSKDQILEWYLNEIPYGGLMTGIEAASMGYFGVHSKDLTLAQAAFLAGLPQSPTEHDPFAHFDVAVARQHEVIDLMVKHGFVSKELGSWAKLEQIVLEPMEQPFLAPHFVQYVGDYLRATIGEEALFQGGLDVHTTLDLALNNKANAILEEHLQTYEDSTNGHNGAVVIIEPPTGQILAMVGSRDYFRDDVDGRVNNALALNSPGSTLKPFTYATAFKQGWGPEWPIIDQQITYKEADGKTFTPRNPDGRTRGVVKLKDALGNSYNIPAFKTILWTGVPEMVATAKSMGITTLDRDLGPALTLGGVDVKLLDMVYGYSTFANNGMMAGIPTTATLPEGNRKLDPMAVLRVEKRRTGETILDNTTPKFELVLDPEYAYMITDILSNDANRAVTYGRGSNLNIPGHRVAAKTGTSEPYEGNKLIGDTWTFGYTPKLAVGVWVGNSNNKPMTNIFSTTIAGRTWHDTFVAALEGKDPVDWVKPAGLVEATVCVPSGRIPVEGKPCPGQSVKGIFAQQSLRRNDDRWWGGQELAEPFALDSRGVPPEITGVKRQLAEEYLRRSAPTPKPSPTPPPPNQGVQPPVAPDIGPRDGNGNGNGNRR